MERQGDAHLNPAELEALVRSHDSETRLEEADVLEARKHVESCKPCRSIVDLYVAQEDRLAKLRPRPAAVRTPGCPPESAWLDLAAGLTRGEGAETLLDHAAACEYCGPLLRQSLEDFAEDVTPEEGEFLARLESARPEWQERMAARAAEQARRPWILRWVGQLLRRIPVPAWAYAGLAVLLATIVAPIVWIVSGPPVEWLRRPLLRRIPVPAWAYGGLAVLVATIMAPIVRIVSGPPVEDLLASAYTAQRNLELRIPQAAYGPMRVLKGAADSSRLDRPPALLRSEARIARKLAENPNDCRWLQARGLAELLDRDFDSAIADFQRCLTTQPGAPRLMIQLACAHFQRAEAGNSQPDYQAALDFLNRALKIAPDDPVALFNRAIVYQRIYLYSRAMQDWWHYLRLDTNSKWADEARKRLTDVQQSESSSEPLGQAAVPEASKNPAALAKARKRLDPLTGTITLNKEPSRLRLTIRQTSGSPMESPSTYNEAPDQLTLPAGHYVLMFKAPGYQPDTLGPIRLTEGQNVTVDVKLHLREREKR